MVVSHWGEALSQIPLSWKPFGVDELCRASSPWRESVGPVSVSRLVLPTLPGVIWPKVIWKSSGLLADVFFDEVRVAACG